MDDNVPGETSTNDNALDSRHCYAIIPPLNACLCRAALMLDEMLSTGPFQYNASTRNAHIPLCTFNQNSPLGMPRRSLARIIHTHKRPVHLLQPLETILQRLRHIMRPAQPRLLAQHDVQFDPDAIARMVRRDGLVGVDHGGEAPGQKGDFLEEGGRDGGAGEPGCVFEAGGGPVGYDEEGEEGGAEGVEPPEGELVAEEGEEEGEGVEDDVGFAV